MAVLVFAKSFSSSLPSVHRQSVTTAYESQGPLYLSTCLPCHMELVLFALVQLLFMYCSSMGDDDDDEIHEEAASTESRHLSHT
ncbi:hypothetical protein PIB30_080197 [Stylosanthes scabra]|uniref:Uncharacterized protein n=1 Tax=Stylosanthes scabra TaxID=79078 RepID=A0ABU6XPQ6_9FABA|nr:hypothetical protein [Stylosanthes scabra]